MHLVLCDHVLYNCACAAQVCINYSDMLGQPLQHTSLKAAALVHHIHISERDAMITESIQQAASRHSSETVVGVVGEDHLQGIAECWETSPVQFLLKTASNISASTQSSAVDAPTYLGVKQALFERFFDLSSSAATCAAMQQILPPLPEEAVEAYQLTWEVYGNSRLMLACLCKQDLAKVSGSLALQQLYVGVNILLQCWPNACSLSNTADIWFQQAIASCDVRICRSVQDKSVICGSY